MREDRTDDEFLRIRLTGEVERDREIVAKYEEGLGFHRARIEANRYELGKLDERLGG
ncbi:hypothetical protein [Catellatospora paridis]|uniref:hypothetical protein n=1 Tax=Catellatospora paridis TaxID=1617086 RepID=UPI0012D4A75C|nr:hypothetical protein [Catellatospora paridis]